MERKDRVQRQLSRVSTLYLSMFRKYKLTKEQSMKGEDQVDRQKGKRVERKEQRQLSAFCVTNQQKNSLKRDDQVERQKRKIVERRDRE